MAILGAINAPISQVLAQTLADIDEQSLDPSELASVKALLNSDKVKISQSAQYGEVYQLTVKAKKEAKEINWPAVKKHLKAILSGAL
jgi:hypothetical protein